MIARAPSESNDRKLARSKLHRAPREEEIADVPANEINDLLLVDAKPERDYYERRALCG